MIKKYLREIEVAGCLLVIIGVIINLFLGVPYAVGPCAIGLLLWLICFVYRAFHWKEYERENKQGIMIILIAIFILIIQMMMRR
ncbi:MAG: hypothetical protein IJ190_13265 [Prevotella sp.]|nr:hypothetical protein [Prevotella sp.]